MPERSRRLLSGGTVGRDVGGIFVSSGFNLIGKVDGASGLTAATDQVGTIAAKLDPKLDSTGLQPRRTIASTDDADFTD